MFRYLTASLAITLFLAGCSTSSEPEELNYTPCQDGTAEGYPCENIDFYAHLSIEELLGEDSERLEAAANDIWGWTDPETSREYALVGLTTGVTFVDVSDPANPVVVGKLKEPAPRAKNNPLMARHDDQDAFKEASSWRDLKVFENYLYVVSEQESHGLQVFDLRRLRDISETPEVLTQDYQYTEFGNAHNLAINKESGYAYVVGSTSGQTCAERGGLHIINLIDNPAEPTFAGCYFEEEAGGITDGQDGYIHDTQCVIYNGPDDRYSGLELCFSSSETTFTITDVDDKQDPATIFSGSYSGNQYSHQGWLTEDHRYFFMNDELDEIRTGVNTRTYVWDIQDLEEPEMIGFYEHNTTSTDHNLYTWENWMYQANYTSGLRVLDISSPTPENITSLGYFNTTPDNNQAGFEGLWSVYPYFSDDKVVVSDINNGLFILRYAR
ncbi:MAG: choice-of-anchor B family protein [Balneolaceae bacterium]